MRFMKRKVRILVRSKTKLMDPCEVQSSIRRMDPREVQEQKLETLSSSNVEKLIQKNKACVVAF